MRFSWKWLRLATVTAALLAGAGCAGLTATQSVSPLMFLVPGLGVVAPAGTPASNPVPEPPSPEVAAHLP